MNIKTVKLDLWFDENILKNYFENKYNMSFSYDKYFEYLKKDEIILLEDNQINQILNLTKNINNIFLKAYELYLSNISWNLKWDYSIFSSHINKIFPIWDYFIWRYDVLIEKNTGNLKFIELNANTPWLITDISDICDKYKPDNLLNYNSDFIEYLKKYFLEYNWKNIWILLPHSFEDEDFLIWKSYENILHQVIPNSKIILGDIYESNMIYDEDFTIKWEKIDVLLNFLPLEFLLSDIDFANKFLNCVSIGRLKLANPIESIILQDKKIYSIIWDNLDYFSDFEKEIIENHIPFSTSKIPENENDFLAKVRFWRMWRGIYEKDFSLNIDNIDNYIFQKKVFSQNIDDNENYLVLGVFTNFKNNSAFISRVQSALITSDDLDNNRVILVYKK